MYHKDILYLLTILEAIEKITLYRKTIYDARELFEAKDQLYFNATINLLIAIGEESKKIDRSLKVRFKFDWRSIVSLRNKLSHDYRGIDPYIIWDIIVNHLPSLKSVCLEIFNDLKIESGLSQDYLARILKPSFYKHLSYLLEKTL